MHDNSVIIMSRRSPQVTQVTAVTAGYMEVTSKLLYAQVAALAYMYQYSYCKVTPGYRGYIKVTVCKGIVSFPDPNPTSREEKGLVYLGRILGSRSTARADPAMQSSDLIGLYGCTGD